MKIKSFSLFNRVFENSSLYKAEECLSVVKEMLKELDFLDISSNSVIRRSDGRILIRISIFKPISQPASESFRSIEDFEKSFSYSDIDSVLMTIKEYLISEGFQIDSESDLTNKGVFGHNSGYLNLRTHYQITFKLVVGI